jgi:oligopeptide transport system permease protein
MLNYILKRILSAIVTLWVVVTVTFVLMHAIPGDPLSSEKNMDPDIKARMEAQYGLDKPLAVQYTTYLKNLLKLDLGPSFKYKGRTVNQLIHDGFHISASLGLVAILVALAIGIPLGITSALHQGKWQDSFVMFISILGITIPSFVLAPLLLYFFSYKLNIFPAMRWGTPKHFVLPAIALAGSPTALIARLTRSSLLDVVKQDYIRTAKAKGVPQKLVIYKHALKNAIIPVITYVGPLLASVMTGSFVIEKIFSIPGIGRQFIDSITNRDFTVILGFTVFYGAFLVICNLLVDLAYAAVDPRIKLDN